MHPRRAENESAIDRERKILVLSSKIYGERSLVIMSYPLLAKLKRLARIIGKSLAIMTLAGRRAPLRGLIVVR